MRNLLLLLCGAFTGALAIVDMAGVAWLQSKRPDISEWFFFIGFVVFIIIAAAGFEAYCTIKEKVK